MRELGAESREQRAPSSLTPHPSPLSPHGSLPTFPGPRVSHPFDPRAQRVADEPGPLIMRRSVVVASSAFLLLMPCVTRGQQIVTSAASAGSATPANRAIASRAGLAVVIDGRDD